MMRLISTDHSPDGTTRRYVHPKHGRVNVHTTRADPEGADVITITTHATGHQWLRVLAHEATVEEQARRKHKSKARARANRMCG